MTGARPAGQGTTRAAASRLAADHGVEVEEILPGHLDYREGQGRSFNVWNGTKAGAGSRWGLGRLSESQLRELGRQIGDLLGPDAGLPEAPGPGDGAQGPASRDGTGSGER